MEIDGLYYARPRKLTDIEMLKLMVLHVLLNSAPYRLGTVYIFD